MNPETRESPNTLAAIYLEHHERVFRAAYRITGNSSDADDVVHSVFLRLANREQQVDNLASYLYRAAINTALDLLRARREGQLVPLDVAEERMTSEADPMPGDYGLRTQLREALAELSPRWAEMFVLKHVEGCDNGEIAELCHTSQAVVAVTLFRARAKLKSALTAKMGGAS